MVYDAQLGRIVLFAGIIIDSTSPDLYRPVADTWALDASSDQWARLAPSSHPWLSSTDIAQDEALVGFGPLAYDAESDAVVYFKSIVDNYDDPTPGFEASAANETWALQGEKQQWVRMGTGDGTAPSAGRFGPRIAYDAQSDRIVLFGGWNLTDRTFPRDTWAYDYNTNTWQKMNPAESPGGRNYHRMVYDPNTDRTILFGGLFSAGALSDTWAYDYGTDTWARLNPVVAPSPRGYHAMAYDEGARVVVLFGGVNAPAETPNAETWVFDPTTTVWTQKSPTTSPSARGWHDMIYAPSTESIVLFGGGPNRFSPNSETWSYNVSSNVWTPLTRPSAPGTLGAAAGDSRVDLTWSAPTSSGGVPITNYRIYRGTASGILSLLDEIGSVLTYTDNSVENGITYYYAVNAVTAAGEGPSSNEVAATPRPEPDTISPTISITSPTDGAILTSTSVTVSGTASDDVALSKIELSRDGANWSQASGTTSWSDTLTLTEGPNKIYARAADTSGNTKTTNISVIVQLPAPPPPPPPPLWVLGVGIGAIGAVAIAATWLVVKRRRGGPPGA